MNTNFKWIGGATWILQVNNCKIACDPVLCPEGHIQDYKYFKTRRLNSPQYSESDFENVNLWLLTHNHEDHIDSDGFKLIEKNSTIISHKSLRPYFKKDINNDIRFLDWNECAEMCVDSINIKVKALPAIHARKTLLGNVVGNGNGYLLDIAGDDSKFCIYVTGDSVYNKSIIKDIGTSNIDLIIANAGSAMVGKSFIAPIIGRITNNISDVIQMNAELNPKIIIPVHWGTFSHYHEMITRESFNEYDNIELLNAGDSINLVS
jgi:L-ascorbate metabolism protein UlaG (beta-lactamase superfamily)